MGKSAYDKRGGKVFKFCCVSDATKLVKEVTIVTVDTSFVDEETSFIDKNGLTYDVTTNESIYTKMPSNDPV